MTAFQVGHLLPESSWIISSIHMLAFFFFFCTPCESCSTGCLIFEEFPAHEVTSDTKYFIQAESCKRSENIKEWLISQTLDKINLPNKSYCWWDKLLKICNSRGLNIFWFSLPSGRLANSHSKGVKITKSNTEPCREMSEARLHVQQQHKHYRNHTRTTQRMMNLLQWVIYLKKGSGRVRFRLCLDLDRASCHLNPLISDNPTTACSRLEKDPTQKV